MFMPLILARVQINVNILNREKMAGRPIKSLWQAENFLHFTMQ